MILNETGSRYVVVFNTSQASRHLFAHDNPNCSHYCGNGVDVTQQKEHVSLAFAVAIIYRNWTARNGDELPLR